jgi:hypothetical protein
VHQLLLWQHYYCAACGHPHFHVACRSTARFTAASGGALFAAHCQKAGKQWVVCSLVVAAAVHAYEQQALRYPVCKILCDSASSVIWFLYTDTHRLSSVHEAAKMACSCLLICRLSVCVWCSCQLTELHRMVAHDKHALHRSALRAAKSCTYSHAAANTAHCSLSLIEHVVWV